MFENNFKEHTHHLTSKKMNTHEFGFILNQMYKSAPYGEQVVHIHLFGIKIS